MESYPVTPAGFSKLKDDLEHLKNVERPQISKEIGAAIELGDLSENFEYHSAKDKQGLIEARVRVLEDQLSRAQVIDPSKLSGERVVFGATVTVMYIDSEEERRFRIVGEPTADASKSWINVASPVARALIGREVGDETKVPGKGGPRMVEIVDVRFD